jgi:hypothetical protein
LEGEAVLFDGLFKGLAFLIVIAEYTKEWCVQFGKLIQGLRLADVPCVNHSFYRMIIEELNDLAHIFQVVVGITDDADSHKYLSKRWTLLIKTPGDCLAFFCVCLKERG